MDPNFSKKEKKNPSEHILLNMKAKKKKKKLKEK